MPSHGSSAQAKPLDMPANVAIMCTCKGTTRSVEAKKLAPKLWALKRRAEPVAQPATDKAVVGCVSLGAKEGERALSCRRVWVGNT